IDVSAGSYHTVGVKCDGTVVATGFKVDGRCDVSRWVDIVSVSAGGSHTIGLKSNGTVVAVGDNKYGQCDVSKWKDLAVKTE
ncbi:MAG: chromosome condensation regulator, partial [Ruminiclostridium sp.]|nr:chromosome condensation regulator [Ruminiclostridium sp.]